MTRRVAPSRNSAIYRTLTVSTKDSTAQSSSSLSSGSTSPTSITSSNGKDPLAVAAKVVVEEKKKTQSQLDDELRLKLEEMSGDGGAAGLEYENGKPVAMKRSVKDNMFRVI